MNTTFELNNIRKDENYLNKKINPNSIIVETFAAMANGKEIGSIKGSDQAVKAIEDLAVRAENGDLSAVAELNTIRRFVIEPLLKEEIKLLSVFGTYTNVGFDETIEREVPAYVGEFSRIQANAGDVVFPVTTVDRYTVPTFTVSGGYAVDYRRVQLGDMTKENEGMNQVRIDIRNRAMKAIITKVYNAIKNATGVKYAFEGSGLTKAGAEGVINGVRRLGRPTIIGDYALLAEFSAWAGYVGTIGASTITGISEAVMKELWQNGILGAYNGAIMAEIPNGYDYTTLNTDGTNFVTQWPAGIGFVVPTGGQSPIATYTRGGLTSFTGNDVKTGKVLTRFDLEVGCDVAKGREFQIGVLCDTSLN